MIQAGSLYRIKAPLYYEDIEDYYNTLVEPIEQGPYGGEWVCKVISPSGFLTAHWTLGTKVNLPPSMLELYNKHKSINLTKEIRL